MERAMRSIAPGIHLIEAPQRFYGLEVGARMTVLELDGGLLLHSPLPVDPEALTALGEPRWILAPNLLHHLYAGPWIEAGLEGWGAPGLAAKRPDLALQEVVSPDAHPFGDEVVLLPMTCFPFTNEVALLHRPSRTLVVTDLVFHFPASAPWTTRAVMRLLGGHPGCRTTLLERFGMRRAAARTELATLAGWDFDRLVMAHGAIVETGGKDALLGAFEWLGRDTTRLLGA